MIPKGWYYLAVKKLNELLKGAASKNNTDSYCFNCFHSFMKKFIKKDFCGIILPSQKYDILKFDQYIKSDKIPCIVYADLEYLIKNRWMRKQPRKVFSNKNR